MLLCRHSALTSRLMVSLEEYGIAAKIRDIFMLTIAVREAAYAMLIYLGPTATLEFDPPCSICDGRSGAVVELGAGNGFLGLEMARKMSLGQGKCRDTPKTLVLTDLNAVCPLLERNCLKAVRKATELSSVNLLVQPLEWGNWDHGLRLADQLTPKASSKSAPPLLTHIVCSDLVSLRYIT